ncbi:MAG: hypothetical protein ACREN2_01905 [Candidatus Dormibacteria bacterium]
MASRFSPWGPQPPPVSQGYSYPVVPQFMVPGSRPRLNRRRFTLFGGGGLTAIVFVITLIAVLVRVIPVPCSRGCGAGPGSQINASLYTNQKWGYTVPYDSSEFSVGDQDANGAVFNAQGGDGAISFSAASGTDLAGANQAALDALSSSSFQNLQQIGPVRGAQIGLVGGQGSGYQGNYVDSSGIATPIGLLVFSATQNNVTITVTAFAVVSNSNDDAPYGLKIGKELDFPVTYTAWKSR